MYGIVRHMYKYDKYTYTYVIDVNIDISGSVYNMYTHDCINFVLLLLTAIPPLP